MASDSKSKKNEYSMYREEEEQGELRGTVSKYYNHLFMASLCSGVFSATRPLNIDRFPIKLYYSP